MSANENLDWKETCAKCMDGEIEPRQCEYYGEPNGCNSPTYGEHPNVGNAAKMREALEFAERQLLDATESNEYGSDVVYLVGCMRTVAAACRAALSAPARQCDVGTAEEQAVRFRDMCNKYYDDENPCNEKCPLASLPIIHGFPRCQSYWAQTPYAEEGAGK